MAKTDAASKVCRFAEEAKPKKGTSWPNHLMTETFEYDNSNKDSSLDTKVFGGLTREQLFYALKHMLEARLTDERVVNLQKGGHAKFGIFGAGKEGVQVAMAQSSRSNDPFVGYYRDIGFCVARGLSTKACLMQAVGVKDDPISGGRSMPNHLGDISIGLHSITSPTGSQMLTAYGIADSWRHANYGMSNDLFRFPSDSIAMATIGDSSMREGEVKECLDNMATDQIPMLFVAENDGMGISVDSHDSVYDGNCMYLHQHQPGVRHEEVDGTDYIACMKLFSELIPWMRKERKPVTLNAHVTALMNHSSTDDRTKYLKVEDIDYRDPITRLATVCIEHGVFSSDQIGKLHDGLYRRIADEALEIIKMSFHEGDEGRETIMSTIWNYDDDECQTRFAEFQIGSDRLSQFRKHCERIANADYPLRLGDATNWTLAQAMIADPRIVAFGEDCADVPRKYVMNQKTGRLDNLLQMMDDGKFEGKTWPDINTMIKDNFPDGLKQKGGVFNVTKNLQRLAGDRCHNTPIAEASIIGKAIGYLVNGMIPVPEIQFMDYLRPAMQQLEDELATLSFRTDGQQQGTCVIRVASSGYLGGAGAIWHSTHEVGPKINRPGYRVVFPTTARESIGLMRTALYNGDPVIFAEPKSLYNRTHLFDNDGFFMTDKVDEDFRIPFGQGKIYREQDSDLTIITYGNTLWMSLIAAQQLAEKGIHCQVVDLRTVKPLDGIDWDLIEQCLDHTGKLLLVDEDREDGGFAQVLAGRLMSDYRYFEKFDAPPTVVAAENSFIPYGAAHEALIATQVSDIVAGAEKLAAY